MYDNTCTGRDTLSSKLCMINDEDDLFAIIMQLLMWTGLYIRSLFIHIFVTSISKTASCQCNVRTVYMLNDILNHSGGNVLNYLHVILDKEITGGKVMVLVKYNTYIKLIDKTYETCEFLEMFGEHCPVSPGTEIVVCKIF